MMAKKKIVREMWAIVGNGNWPNCISFYRRDTIAEFLGDENSEYFKPWSHWRRHGMRCVKVKVVIEEAR